MDPRAYLGTMDYVVIGITLVIPSIIGLKFRSKKKIEETSKKYLLAGKDMPIFPVIMSITVTMLSGITMLGQPAEIYKYGLQLLLLCVGFPIGTVLSSYIFLPVYFQCVVSTSYEQPIRIADYSAEKLVNVLDKNKQLTCGSVIAELRRKRPTDGADCTHLVVPFPVIVTMVVMDRVATSRTIAQQIQSVTHHSVSTRTIQRRFQQSGMSAREGHFAYP
ncbi:sodium-coupled monocarboxylate transporter 1 [Trichonephila clavipes]|uniref:Sodium-coupled monocarboxylate transporter 1 n=1 Tax=Trichonephila clavipes TaxID=2585209 RepID=A0A8X6VB97_TRICX|nr:sodium-coupled monocarboxylate transporter 1 [Trichonephila clavipes]